MTRVVLQQSSLGSVLQQQAAPATKVVPVPQPASAVQAEPQAAVRPVFLFCIIALRNREPVCFNPINR